MVKRQLATLISLIAVIVLVFISYPSVTIMHAADNPGACSKLAVATRSASAASTAPATAAAAAQPTTAAPAATVGSGSHNLALSGAFALYPLAQRWSDEYTKLHADVQFDIQAGGAGKGMTDVLAGAVDIAMLSRAVRKEETDKGAVAFPVAIDAVVFTINDNNPVIKQIQAKGLTCATLQKIFLGGGKLTWGQVVGTDDATPINVYTRADASGAADETALYLGGVGQADIQGLGMQGDPGVLDAVRKDSQGIGYNNIGFAYDPSTGSPSQGIAIVPLDQNGNGTLDPDETIYATQKDIMTAIAANKYPAPPARALYLVTKGAPQGAARDFIKWALSDGQAFVEESGYVKVS